MAEPLIRSGQVRDELSCSLYANTAAQCTEYRVNASLVVPGYGMALVVSAQVPSHPRRVVSCRVAPPLWLRFRSGKRSIAKGAHRKLDEAWTSLTGIRFAGQSLVTADHRAYRRQTLLFS